MRRRKSDVTDIAGYDADWTMRRRLGSDTEGMGESRQRLGSGAVMHPTTSSKSDRGTFLQPTLSSGKGVVSSGRLVVATSSDLTDAGMSAKVSGRSHVSHVSNTSNVTVRTDVLMRAFRSIGADSMCSESKMTSAGTLFSMAPVGSEFEKMTFILEQDVADSKTRNNALKLMLQESAAKANAPPGRGLRTAEIILVHQSPHNFECERVCLVHVEFLIRVLPKGTTTPLSELPIKEMAKIVRRKEEQFVLKTYAQFQELHAALSDPEDGEIWDEASYITNIPALPAKAVAAEGLWGRMFVRERRNPHLDSELQRFLDVLTTQLPSGDLDGDYWLADFFSKDQVPLGHPLVQHVLTVQGHDFPGFV